MIAQHARLFILFALCGNMPEAERLRLVVESNNFHGVDIADLPARRARNQFRDNVELRMRALRVSFK
jgi:hypothetical protein